MQQLRIAVSDPAGDTEYVIVGYPVVVGRDPCCGVRLRDATVSGIHVIIAHDDGAVVLRDLGSRNGTTVVDAGARRELHDEVMRASGEDVELRIGMSTLRVTLARHDVDSLSSGTIAAARRGSSELRAARATAGRALDGATVRCSGVVVAMFSSLQRLHASLLENSGVALPLRANETPPDQMALVELTCEFWRGLAYLAHELRVPDVPDDVDAVTEAERQAPPVAALGPIGSVATHAALPCFSVERAPADRTQHTHDGEATNADVA